MPVNRSLRPRPRPESTSRRSAACARAGATAVLCLTLSSRYSGAHSSAVKAAEYAAKELPGPAAARRRYRWYRHGAWFRGTRRRALRLHRRHPGRSRRRRRARRDKLQPRRPSRHHALPCAERARSVGPPLGRVAASRQASHRRCRGQNRRGWARSYYRERDRADGVVRSDRAQPGGRASHRRNARGPTGTGTRSWPAACRRASRPKSCS